MDFHGNRTTKGEGWSIAHYLKPPSNFIVGRLKVALLFWFFGSFRCGEWFIYWSSC